MVALPRLERTHEGVGEHILHLLLELRLLDDSDRQVEDVPRQLNDLDVLSRDVVIRLADSADQRALAEGVTAHQHLILLCRSRVRAGKN